MVALYVVKMYIMGMLKSKNSANWKRMNRRGKKTVKNIANNVELKKKFVELQIFTCELRYTGCMGNTMLSFAHSKRRRKFTEDSDWTEVILACTPCHFKLDTEMSHDETEATVKQIIANRN